MRPLAVWRLATCFPTTKLVRIDGSRAAEIEPNEEP
jgi:hypothetical protein